MTVKELIAALNDVPEASQNRPVVVEDGEWGIFEIATVRVIGLNERAHVIPVQETEKTLGPPDAHGLQCYFYTAVQLDGTAVRTRDARW